MKNAVRIIKPLVSIGFFVVLFLFVSKSDLLARMRSIDPVYFTLSFLLIPFLIGLSCLKWKVLLDHQGYRLPFGWMMRVYMIGYFFTNLLPSTVGGDVVRSYYAGQRIGNQTHAAVSVFIERLSGLLLLLVLGMTAPLLKPDLYHEILVIIPAGLSAVLLLVIAWVWCIREPLRVPDRIARAVFTGWRGLNRALRLTGLNRWVDRLERVYVRMHRVLEHFHAKLVAAVNAIGADRKTFAVLVLLTLVFYVMTWVNVYFAFRTFNVRPDFLDMAAVIPTIMLSFLLPVSQGNLGLAEGAYVYYFGLVGIDVASALAMALFLRFKLLCSGTVGYFFYLAHREARPRLAELEVMKAE